MGSDMTIQRNLVKYGITALSLLAALIASPLGSAKSPRETNNGQNLTNVAQTFIKTVSTAEPGYEWMRGFVGEEATLAEQVELQLHFPKNHPALGPNISADTILVLGTTSKNVTVPEGPVPDYNGRPDQKDTTRLGCTTVTIGTTFQFADVDYEWEWQYRVDSDGDGTNDSDPGWVLISVSIKLLAPNVASFCQ